jgi:diaminopimelate epimerase
LRETANVECAYVINRSEIRMRVLERGTGETQACGTGACAVATAAMDRGLTDSRVTVHLRGGDLEVSRNAEGVICLTGPATIVYTGEFILEES